MLLKNNIHTDYQTWVTDPENKDFEKFVTFVADKYNTNVNNMIMILSTFDWAKDKIPEIRQSINEIIKLAKQSQNEQKLTQIFKNSEAQIKQSYRDWKKTPTTKDINLFVNLMAQQYNVSLDIAVEVLKTFNWLPLK